MVRYLALTCEALARSVYTVAAQIEPVITVQLLAQGLHDRPRNLRAALQAQIDAIEPDRYDAILLVYGMCGLSTVHLTARQTPMVLPRAHDCITLYLGSKERYQEEFDQHPGTYWYSVDYLERGGGTALGAAGIEANEAQYEQFVQKFGKEAADDLMAEMRRWSQHYTRAVFIDTGLGDAEKFEQIAIQKAAREGWIFERKQGSRRLIEMLLNGQWSDDEFLVVPPNHTIKPSGSDLIRAEPMP